METDTVQALAVILNILLPEALRKSISDNKRQKQKYEILKEQFSRLEEQVIRQRRNLQCNGGSMTCERCKTHDSCVWKLCDECQGRFCTSCTAECAVCIGTPLSHHVCKTCLAQCDYCRSLVSPSCITVEVPGKSMLYICQTCSTAE